MRYTYTVAWAVVGGISLPKETPTVELSSAPTHRFLLTSEPDAFLLISDRATALRRLALRKVVGHLREAEVSTVLPSTIEEVVDVRRKKAAGCAVLIGEAYGQVEVTAARRILDGPGFAVFLEAVDTKSLRRAHQESFDALRAALALTSSSLPRYRLVSEGLELRDTDETASYSITFEMSGEVSVATSLRPSQATETAARFGELRRAKDLRVVRRLFAVYSDADTDNLRRFLAGWAALEVFVNTRFAEYRDVFMSPLISGSNPGLREHFLLRLGSVMKMRYKPADKFLAIAAILFDDVPETEVKKEVELFARLAKQRNRLYHGKEVDERSLPVNELGVILRKCLAADLRHRAKAVPAMDGI